MKVYGNDALLCTIPLGDCIEAKEFSAPVSVKMTGMTELRFVYEGKGVIDFLSFAL
jgi:hypothetical protein